MALHPPDTFQAIADRTRRDMLLLLSKDKLSINSLAANFDISRPAVSKHVKVLSEAGLITITDHGRERYCELNHRGFHELREWLDYYDRFWKGKLKKLETLLNNKAKRSSP